MFSGISTFFEPVNIKRKDTAPTHEVVTVRALGDEREEHASFKSFENAPGTTPPDNADAALVVDPAFDADKTYLSLAALRLMLIGASVPPEKMPSLPENPAAAAYARADATAPPRSAPDAGGIAGDGDMAAGNSILRMLEALERQHISSVAIADGDSIYGTLRSLCRAQGIDDGTDHPSGV